MGIKSFLFSDPVNMLLARSLDMQSTQISAISSNMANMDTPGYKAVEVDFEAALNSFVDNLPADQLRATNPTHFGVGNDKSNPVPMKEQDEKSLRVDGNNVNVDKELAGLAKAQLIYSAAVNAIIKKGGIVKAAIESKF